MATYNGALYIREQVDSILSQLSDEDELVVSDDSSSDATVSILESYCDSRIKIFCNDGKRGVVGNFENALMHAQGDYIFLSDQDDVWLEHKVAQCLDCLQKTDLVIHDAMIVDSQLVPVANSFFSLHRTSLGYVKNLIHNSFMGCCMAFRSTIRSYILPFPKNIVMHDMWIGLCVELKGTVTMIDQPLILYRRHHMNASSTAQKSSLSKCEQLKYRLQMLGYTLLRR